MSEFVGQSEEFVKLLTDHQIHLRGFIMAAVADHANTADVLQQTNVVLWQKAAELEASDQFLPWALTVAKYKILSFVRDRQRSRVVFSSPVVDAMIEMAAAEVPEIPMRQAALRDCLKKVNGSNVDILRRRYVANHSIEEISSKTGRSIDSIKGLLKRVRRSLGGCIEQRLRSADSV